MRTLGGKKSDTSVAGRGRSYFRTWFLKCLSVSSLRVRLLLIVAVAIIPALGLIIYGASEHRRLDAIGVQENALRLARLASANQERLIEAAQQVLTLLAELPEVRRQNSVGCNERFAEFLEKFPLYANFGAIKPNGDIYCSALPTKGLVNVADRAYFRNALKKRGFAVGEYQIGRIHGKPAVNFGYPVLGKNGAVSAVVFASLDLAWLNQFIAKAELPQAATLKVIDHNGTILVRHPDPEEWVGKPTSGDILKTVLSRHEGVGESVGVDGTPSLFAFAPLGGTKDFALLHIVVGIPKSVAFAESNRILKENLSGLGIVAILALFAAWYGGNLFVLGPVNALMNATRRLGTGELGARTGLPHKEGEIGQLARTFDEMAVSLEQRYRELQALHEIDVAITSTLDLPSVLNLLLEKIDFLLPYDASAILLLSKETGELESAAVRNIGEEKWKTHTARIRAGNSLARTAVETRSPLVIRNVESDARTRDQEFFIDHGFVSYVSIPLIDKGEALGVLALYAKEERVFTDDEVKFFSTLAGQAAIAIKNARLYHDAETRSGKLRVLSQTAHVMSSTLEYEKVTDVIARKALDLLQVDLVRVWIANSTGQTLRLQASCGLEDLEATNYAEIPMGKGVIGAIWETRQPSYIRDLKGDPRWLNTRFLAHSGLHSFAGVPLIAGDKAVGIMSVFSRKPRTFTLEEQDFMSLLADHAAVAICNSELYEETRKQALELERANNVKDEFLSVMSHELRTPLNVVMGYTGMIKDGMLGEINQQQQEALGKVIRRAKDLLDMINEILQTTSIEAKAVKAEPHEVNLGEFFENLRSNYDFSLNKEVSLVWDHPYDLPIVESDGEKLKHIFQNLVNNALKFTANGQVTVTVRYLEGEKTLEFRVADTGIGIAKEALPLIFERFRQVDSSETRLYGGVGMGLYIVKKFTEVLGGKVHVESELGKGSVFTVMIPCQRAR